jgi:hypothetical protein
VEMEVICSLAIDEIGCVCDGSMAIAFVLAFALAIVSSAVFVTVDCRIWEVWAFEHHAYGGRSAVLRGANCSSCVSLRHEKLCTEYPKQRCIPAYNTISSIQFYKEEHDISCVRVYRDLNCAGIPVATLTKGSHCSKYFCGSTVWGHTCPEDCDINDQIGSISTCEYPSQTCEDNEIVYKQLSGDSASLWESGSP